MIRKEIRRKPRPESLNRPPKKQIAGIISNRMVEIYRNSLTLSVVASPYFCVAFNATQYKGWQTTNNF